MKFSFVRVICIIGVFLCAGKSVKAQENYHLLTVNDFQGSARATGDNSVAFTHCSIDYKYHVKGENNHYRLTFDVKLLLDKKQSWLDKKHILSQSVLAGVLKHEQGHYNIAYMEQQEILREAGRTFFDANYQAEASALFNRIHSKYDQLNINYDADTRHMLDTIQQHSWDVYFQKRLNYMPPVQIARN